MKYTQKDVDTWCEEHHETDASELFNELLPKHTAKLKRLDARIAAILDEIREVFPDAEYYTASGGFNLLLGSSHSDDRYTTPQYQRQAWNGTKAAIGDGDW